MTPSTAQPILGDVLLAALPYHERSGAKLRPVLAVLNGGDDDIVVVPITSHSPRGAFDFPIEFWQAAGLAIASTVRIDKTAVIAKSAITRQLGRLSVGDLEGVAALLCRAFCQEG